MNVLIIIGIVLGAATTFTDRVIRPVPSKLAIVLYVVAIALIIAGIIITRSKLS
jgi:hypothetical protein